MSIQLQQTPDREPVEKPTNPLGFLLMAALIIAWLTAAASAYADSVAETDVQSPAVDVQAAAVIEEIVVVAKRRPDTSAPEVSAEEQREADLARELLRHADQASDTAPSLLEIESPRLNWGYDPVDDGPSADTTSHNRLPLDVVAPATVFRLDF